MQDLLYKKEFIASEFENTFVLKLMSKVLYALLFQLCYLKPCGHDEAKLHYIGRQTSIAVCKC